MSYYLQVSRSVLLREVQLEQQDAEQWCGQELDMGDCDDDHHHHPRLRACNEEEEPEEKAAAVVVSAAVAVVVVVVVEAAAVPVVAVDKRKIPHRRRHLPTDFAGPAGGGPQMALLGTATRAVAVAAVVAAVAQPKHGQLRPRAVAAVRESTHQALGHPDPRGPQWHLQLLQTGCH